MPIYEYECKECGLRFEKLQKMSDRPIDTCPLCFGEVKKLISSGSFRIRGKGVYKPTSGLD